MSKEVKIFIGERRLDLYEGVSIPLNFNISDVSEITKRAGSYSKTIKIPATANNNQILGYANDLKSRFREEGENLEDGALTQIVKETARVEANGLTIFTGFIKPLGATLNKDGCYSEYSINVFADNNDWATAVKDLSLKDLDWTNHNHDYDKATIDANEGIGNNFIYPLINFGKFSRNGGKGVNVIDRVPAWNVKEAFLEIFSNQGYSIESNFINNFLFGRLYVPTTGKFELTDAEAAAITFGASSTGGVFFSQGGKRTRVDKTIISTVIGTPGVRVLTVSLSKIEFEGYDNIGGATNNLGSTSWKYQLKVDGVIVTELTGEQSNSFDITNLTLTSPTISFTGSEVIQVILNIGGNNFPTNSNRATHQTTTITSVASKKVPEGFNLNFKNFIPDITQLEFIQGLTQMFNLYFYADVDTRKVYIEPRDDFYFSTDTAIDWSSKLDNNKNCDIKYLGDNLKKNINYRYKEDDKDEWVDFWEFENKDIYSNHKEVLENKFTSGSEDKSNKIFSPTFMDVDPSIGFSSTKIPKMWNDVPDGNNKPGFSTHFNLRILVYLGPTAMGNNQSWDWAGETKTVYPRAFSVDESTANNNSLNFNDNSQGLGLFNRYFANTHKLINFGKRVILYLNLTDVDIINLDLRQIVYIDGCYYYVESIKDYDTTEKKTTKVELLTVIDLNPEPESTVTEPIRSISFNIGFSRRGAVPLSSDFDGNLVGGLNNDTNGLTDTVLLGNNLTPTSKRQLMLGNARILSTEAVDDSPMILTGEVEDCDTGDLTGKPLLQFDRDGNMIVGGGEIYTSFGNPILYNNDVCNLQKIQKDNVNN